MKEVRLVRGGGCEKSGALLEKVTVSYPVGARRLRAEGRADSNEL